jgi:hypothetical protein
MIFNNTVSVVQRHARPVYLRQAAVPAKMMRSFWMKFVIFSVLQDTSEILFHKHVNLAKAIV